MTQDVWFSMPIAEQMLNIGGEIERSINWKEKHPDKRNRFFEEACRCFILTLNDPKNENRMEEILTV